MQGRAGRNQEHSEGQKVSRKPLFWGSPKDSKRIQKEQKGSKGLEKAPSGSKRLQKTPKGSKGLQKASNGSKSLQKDPNLQAEAFFPLLLPQLRYSVSFLLNALGQTVVGGRRLCLSLSPCYWPLAWPPRADPGLHVSDVEIRLPTVPRRCTYSDVPSSSCDFSSPTCDFFSRIAIFSCLSCDFLVLELRLFELKLRIFFTPFLLQCPAPARPCHPSSSAPGAKTRTSTQSVTDIIYNISLTLPDRSPSKFFFYLFDLQVKLP